MAPVVKSLPASMGDKRCKSIPGLERSPEEENGNLFQYSCLEKSHGQRSLDSLKRSEAYRSFSFNPLLLLQSPADTTVSCRRGRSVQ